MAISEPTQLSVMKQITGTQWDHGEGPNPTIGSWLDEIGEMYPEMAAYCNSVLHLDYFEWCGLTVAYCLSKAGRKPVFGNGDLQRFLWAAAWLDFGQAVQSPQPGDVVVFRFAGGGHHVTLFESDLGNGYWACRGGNQSHQVKVTNFAKSSVMGVRRPQDGAALAIASSRPEVTAPSLSASDPDDTAVKNAYKELPVLPYARTTMTAPAIAAALLPQTPNVEVARAAYVLICNESGSGKAGINNNYGGLQADVGRWSHDYDALLSGTCVVVDSGRSKRRFLCFRDAPSCFHMITDVMKKRGLYVGGTSSFIVAAKIENPTDWASTYYKAWVTGDANANIPAASLHSLLSLYQNAIDLIPDNGPAAPAV